jgi:uncharacterized protein (TIGR03083 family)
MDVPDWLRLVRDEGRLLAETARGGLDVPVPTCPGWTVRDVVGHTGVVYAHKVAALETGRRPEPGSFPQDPDAADPVGWFLAQHERLLAALAAREPGERVWTWYPPDETARFWYRRMAHETAVHRVDVQGAFDDVTPVDGALAVDGVDELLAVFVPADMPGETVVGGSGQRVAVRTGDHAWRVTLHPVGVELDHEAFPVDASVSGEPSELYLYLWGRRPESAVQVDGDVEALRALRSVLVACTQ